MFHIADLVFIFLFYFGSFQCPKNYIKFSIWLECFAGKKYLNWLFLSLFLFINAFATYSVPVMLVVGFFLYHIHVITAIRLICVADVDALGIICIR